MAKETYAEKIARLTKTYDSDEKEDQTGDIEGDEDYQGA
jgi:hypothetical protein